MPRIILVLTLCALCTACGGAHGPAGHAPLTGAAAPAPAATGVDATFQQEQLAKLAAAPTPTGVDPALWKVLTAHLAALLADPGKAVRSAPTTPASAARLVLDPVAHTLSWGYSMQGDYDQNGEVNVADLQPLGVHFSQSSGGGPFPLDSIQAIVDGDSNGEINIADLQPLGANFGRKSSQYQIYSSASFADYPTTPTAPNGAGAVLVGTVTQAQATGTANQGRLQFSYNLPAFALGTFYWIRPSDGTLDGTPSNVVSTGAAGNLPPVAVLLATGSSGNIPLTVSLDASASSDPDGASHDISDIKQFQWDLDGDGSFDLTTTTPTISHVYQSAGSFHPAVQVTDAGGAVALSQPVIVQATVNGNLPPVPALTADKQTGHAALNVTFDASGTTDDAATSGLDYDWDFNGDGVDDFDSGNIPAATHLYPAAGTYQARVRVTDAGGLTSNATLTIKVGAFLNNLPPVASFTATPASGAIPFAPTFDFSASHDPDGHIVLYEFDYQGDGIYDVSSSTPPASLQFQYTTVGVYYARLRVTDDQGATSIYELPVRPNNGLGGAVQFGHTTNPTSGNAPLDVSFDCTASGVAPATVIDYGFDFDGDGFIDAHGFSPVAEHTYPNAGTYAPVLWMTDSDGECELGQPLGTITVTDPTNTPPTAQLTIAQNTATFPASFTLDASTSFDNDGSIVKYEWDWDGDGTFDYDSGPLPYVTHDFAQAGNFTPAVRVTDNDGAKDTASGTPLTVTTGWHARTFTYVMGHGDTSITAVDYTTGAPHRRLMAAFADSSGSYSPLVLVSAEDHVDQWDGQALPETNEQCAGAVALTTADGMPALFYQRVGNNAIGGLSLVRALDVAGAGWHAPQNLDSTGQFAAQMVQCTNAGGNVGVATADFNTGAINFARALDASGADWPSLLPAATPPVGAVTGLGLTVLASGDPAVGIPAYYGSNLFESETSFCTADDVAGTSWFPNPTVLQGPDSSYAGNVAAVGCALVDGNPAIAFEGPNGKLLFMRASNQFGLNWSQKITVDNLPGYGVKHNYINLIVVDGKPTVVCQRNATDVVTIQAKDADGTAWDELQFVDSAGDVGEGCAATVDGSDVFISYLDPANHREKVAYR